MALRGRHAHQGKGSVSNARRCCSKCSFRCSGAATLQVHRHHLGLRWPDGATRLGERPLVVRVDAALDEHGGSEDLFACFSRINGQIFSRLRDVEFDP